MSKEERLKRTCAGLVEMMLAMGAESSTAYKVAGLFAAGIEREWVRAARRELKGER